MINRIKSGPCSWVKRHGMPGYRIIPGGTVIMGLLIVNLTLLIPHFAVAQTGSLTGMILQSESEKPLPLARIRLTESDFAISDSDGRFFISNIVPGVHQIIVSALGFEPRQISVTVHSGKQTMLTVPLESRFNEGDRLYLVSEQREMARVLARKFDTKNQIVILTSKDIQRFEDYSVRDALIRLPGVQAGRRGEINVRGVGRNAYSASVDGLRLTSSDPASRWFDFGVISAILLQDLELIKVVTPDMDAQTLGGVVNMNTMKLAGVRNLDVRLGGVADPGIFGYSGLGNIASVSYSERYREDFSMAAELSYHKDNRGFQHLELDYRTAILNGGTVDVVERVSPGISLEERTRINGRIQMTYQPSKRSTFKGSAIIMSDERVRDRHRNSSEAGEDWITPSLTGQEGEKGSFGYEALMQPSDDRYYVIQLQGRHLLGFANLDYQLGWVRSNIDQQSYDFRFFKDKLNYDIDMENHIRPVMTINNWSLLQDNTLDRRQLMFQPTERVINEQLEDRYSTRIDLEIPYQAGSLKLGGSSLMTRSERGFEESDVQTLRNFNMTRFETIPRGDITVMGQYYIPWLINTENARLYTNTNKPIMRIDESDLLRRSEYGNYYAEEDVFAGYGMAFIELGPIGVMGGARIEHTDAVYEGRKVTFNRFNNFESTENYAVSARYTDVFPNAQLFVTPLSGSRLQLAWSKSLYRQDYNLLAPFELSLASDTSRFMGNADLKPMYSDNLDLIFEQMFGSSGSFSVGAFYKKISNFVILEERTVDENSFPNLTISEGEWVTVTERQYVNSSNDAIVYGLEATWQQQLMFLPTWLGKIGIYANYTWSQSEQENARNGDSEPLLFQSPHVINMALSYTKSRFTGQLAYHWTASSLYEIASERTMAPSLNTANPVYLDRYVDGWKDLSATFGFRLSEQFRLWGAVENILPSERRIYGKKRNVYPFETDYRPDIRLSLGLRFTL